MLGRSFMIKGIYQSTALLTVALISFAFFKSAGADTAWLHADFGYFKTVSCSASIIDPGEEYEQALIVVANVCIKELDPDQIVTFYLESQLSLNEKPLQAQNPLPVNKRILKHAKNIPLAQFEFSVQDMSRLTQWDIAYVDIPKAKLPDGFEALSLQESSAPIFEVPVEHLKPSWSGEKKDIKNYSLSIKGYPNLEGLQTIGCVSHGASFPSLAMQKGYVFYDKAEFDYPLIVLDCDYPQTKSIEVSDQVSKLVENSIVGFAGGPAMEDGVFIGVIQGAFQRQAQKNTFKIPRALNQQRKYLTVLPLSKENIYRKDGRPHINPLQNFGPANLGAIYNSAYSHYGNYPEKVVFSPNDFFIAAPRMKFDREGYLSRVEGFEKNHSPGKWLYVHREFIKGKLVAINAYDYVHPDYLESMNWTESEWEEEIKQRSNPHFWNKPVIQRRYYLNQAHSRPTSRIRVFPRALENETYVSRSSYSKKVQKALRAEGRKEIDPNPIKDQLFIIENRENRSYTHIVFFEISKNGHIISSESHNPKSNYYIMDKMFPWFEDSDEFNRLQYYGELTKITNKKTRMSLFLNAD